MFIPYEPRWVYILCLNAAHQKPLSLVPAGQALPREETLASD